MSTLNQTSRAQKPRNLRVIRVDDNAGGTVSREDYSPDYGDGVVYSPLELVTFEAGSDICLGISGLESSELFWGSFQKRSLPDIVIADVDFERDKSTPIQQWSPYAQHIPTGLSHVRPLAAMARCAGRPLSIGIHTADWARWKKLVAETDESRIFGLLAAHEIIELASILGEPICRGGREDFEPVWQWLRDKTMATPDRALKLAVSNYRETLVLGLTSQNDARQLDAIRVPWGEARGLKSWCEQMIRHPLPLIENDPGLPILFPDGTSDRITFSSLFADVDNISDRILPERCFIVQKGLGSPWELDQGLPQIGILIFALESFDTTIHRAVEALAELPISPGTLSKNLRDLIPDNPEALGLAVIFRALDFFHADQQTWELAWESGWDPIAIRPFDDATENGYRGFLQGNGIRYWLTKVFDTLSTLHGEESEFFDVALVSERLGDQWTSDATVFHLNLLCQLGYAEREIDGLGPRYRRVGDAEMKDLSPTAVPGIDGMRTTSLSSALRDSLGFGGTRGPGKANNDNAIGQVLFDAFLDTHGQKVTANRKSQNGRQFLERCLRGDAPGWIKHLCKCYCVQYLNWGNYKTWPDWVS